VARREIAIFLVRVVLALTPVVTLLIFLNTLFAIFALELRQLAGRPVVAVLLVAVVPAVEVSVADLVPGDPQAFGGALYRAALVVALVLLSVVTVALVALVVAVGNLVASEVRLDAVGRVELVISTRKLARLAVGGRAVVQFVLSIFTVFMIVTDPSLRYTFAAFSTLKLVRTASFRDSFSLWQFTVLGAGHVAVQPRSDIITCRLQVTRATWLPLAPGPELARGVLCARALARRA